MFNHFVVSGSLLDDRCRRQPAPSTFPPRLVFSTKRNYAGGHTETTPPAGRLVKTTSAAIKNISHPKNSG